VGLWVWVWVGVGVWVCFEIICQPKKRAYVEIICHLKQQAPEASSDDDNDLLGDFYEKEMGDADFADGGGDGWSVAN
jgi:hypothetical protein